MAAAKLQLLEEETKKNEEAVQTAVSTAERHWQHKWDTEMDHELEARLTEGKYWLRYMREHVTVQ